MRLQDDLMVMMHCNFKGEIEEIIYHKNPLTMPLKIGQGILSKLALDKDKALRLKGMLDKKEQIFDFVISTSSQGPEKQRILHGFPLKQGYLVLIEEGLYCGEDCLNSYEEIMKLNSKFANAQREVAKKNEELKRVNQKLETLAIKDSLTGLYNRYVLEEKFQETLKRCKRMGEKFSMAMVDFNNFKKVNDEFGHSAGDQLLIDFARLATEETRSGLDFVFRIGGDEFLFLFENCSEEKAEEVIFRLEKELKKYTTVATLAYGVLEVPVGDEVQLDKLLIKVDEKMYINKRKKHQKDR